jgi:hypothetical protein
LLSSASHFGLYAALCFLLSSALLLLLPVGQFLETGLILDLLLV